MFRAALLEDLRRRQSTLQNVGDLPRIDARLRAEDERFGERLDDNGDHDPIARLTTCPVPDGPAWMMVVPRTSKIGRTRANAASGPPTMIDNVPAIAPCSPPLTGGSSMAAPASSARAVGSRATRAAIDLTSMANKPGRRAANAPSRPR
jgi:hypothetical protein